MSVIEMTGWFRRKRRRQDHDQTFVMPELKIDRDGRYDLRAGIGPNFRVSEDMMADLDRALIDERGQPPLGTPVRTSNLIAEEISYFSERGDEARALAEQADTRVMELRTEFYARLEEETAAIRAEHDSKLADLDKLKASVAVEKKEEQP